MQNELDRAVKEVGRNLAEADVPKPDVLFLLGTGKGLLPELVTIVEQVPLAGAPHPWTEETLTVARLGDLVVWILEALGDDPRFPGQAPWRAGFPVWLSARAGASVLVHVSAGSLLTRERSDLVAGGLAVVSDHLNLSGHSPLTGLGESGLGPLFPDQSLLHHRALRDAALERARGLALDVGEVVAACTAGPTVETDAERAWFRAAGADVAVQSLSTPVHAAAHAGMRALFVVALTDAGERPVKVASLARLAERTQPTIAALLASLRVDLEAAVANLTDEEVG